MIVDEHILKKHSDNSYRFNTPVAHFLNLVSGIDISLIKDARIYPRSISRYIPWYRSTKGGGAITLGSNTWQSITFTDNFFSSDQEKYKGRAYGDNLHIWLRLAAHEVGHLEHARKYGSLLVYLIIFIYQYLIHGHDKAPLEKEADKGSQVYGQFNYFINRCIGSRSLENLLCSEVTPEEKIDMINQWWLKFNNQTSASLI